MDEKERVSSARGESGGGLRRWRGRREERREQRSRQRRRRVEGKKTVKGGEGEEEIGRASQPQGEGKEPDMKARLFQQSACTGGEEQIDGGAAGTSWSWWRVGEVRATREESK